MLHIAICDDDPEMVERITPLLTNWYPEEGRESELRFFRNSSALLSTIQNSIFIPEIIVLDIVLGDENGIAAAGELTRMLPRAQIIFMSSFDAYVSDVYAVPHCFFFRKTEMDRYLPAALQKAMENLSIHQTISFRADGVLKLIEAEDILFLERILRKTRIVCAQAEFLSYAHPRELLAQAPATRFIHCHQSYWVNCAHIAELRNNTFRLDNGEEIPISRAKMSRTKTAWFSYLHGGILTKSMEESPDV